MQAIRDLPGENYLLDLELALLDVTFHYKISDVWTAYVIASGVSYQGGFLDSTIEGFHDTFGFSTFGRPAVSRNQVNLIYDLKSTQYSSLGIADRRRLARSDVRRALHGLDAAGQMASRRPSSR